MGRAGSVALAASLLLITATSPTVGAGRRAAPATQAAGSAAIVPFEIHVPDAVLADLQDRLAKVRYPAEIDESGWRYGANLAYMKELVAYWRERYDWRAQERRLNRFEQFKTNIDGLDVHFIHQRSALPDAVPIIIVHGWPGSFVEFHKVIEPLTDPVRFGGRPEDAFHVIVPSLPGYGFSDQPREPGYDPPAMAAMFVKLMSRLGYTRYIAQGGDWGGPITAAMAVIDPDHAMGLHSNQCSAGPPAGAADPFEGVPAFEITRMRERETFWTEQQRGYSIIQGTRPQTLGFALNDSPAGLAAWIIDKFRAWSDVDGDVESKFTKDELLTNVTVYWVTETPTSAARLYFELRNKVGWGYSPSGFPDRTRNARIETPTGCLVSPKEIQYTPRKWLEARYNLKHFTLSPRGGHFAAMEEPELFVQDLRAFLRTIRSAPPSAAR